MGTGVQDQKIFIFFKNSDWYVYISCSLTNAQIPDFFNNYRSPKETIAWCLKLNKAYQTT